MRAGGAIVLAVTLAALAVQPVLAADALQYKFSAGENLTYEFQMSSKGSFHSPSSKPHAFQFSTRATVELKCLEAAGGSYKLSMKVTKSETKKGEGGRTRTKPEERIVTLGPTGELVGAGAEDMQLFVVFPAKALAVGESFETAGSSAGEGGLKVSTKYTLMSIDARIKGNGNGLAKFKAETTAESGTTAEKVSSSSDGELLFDVAKGRMVLNQRKAQFKASYPIEIPGAEKVAMTLEYDLNLRVRLVR